MCVNLWCVSPPHTLIRLRDLRPRAAQCFLSPPSLSLPLFSPPLRPSFSSLLFFLEGHTSLFLSDFLTSLSHLFHHFCFEIYRLISDNIIQITCIAAHLFNTCWPPSLWFTITTFDTTIGSAPAEPRHAAHLDPCTGVIGLINGSSHPGWRTEVAAGQQMASSRSENIARLKVNGASAVIKAAHTYTQFNVQFD